ncbi:MAG: hypothetical protein AAGA56_10755 [Myxococcota bacterium]
MRELQVACGAAADERCRILRALLTGGVVETLFPPEISDAF